MSTDSRYDTNRDWIVGNLTGQRVNRSEIAADHSTSGKVYMRGWEYTTTVNWDDTLLPKNRSEWLARRHEARLQTVSHAHVQRRSITIQSMQLRLCARRLPMY